MPDCYFSTDVEIAGSLLLLRLMKRRTSFACDRRSSEGHERGKHFSAALIKNQRGLDQKPKQPTQVVALYQRARVHTRWQKFPFFFFLESASWTDQTGLQRFHFLLVRPKVDKHQRRCFLMAPSAAAACNCPPASLGWFLAALV